jgi:predicted nuclease with RNAse H fold
MRILGLDLAGKITHPTGVCMMNEPTIEFKIVYTNEEIIDIVNNFKPDIIAVDAPLMKNNIKTRKADLLLRKYGALPPVLKGMTTLVKRARRLLSVLNDEYMVIEVFPTATAKILGLYNRDYRLTIKELGLEISSKHELDAYLCCVTAKKHTEGETITVGDNEEGVIIIPKNH